jgi:cyclopropane-fatty-acyl-phospholipid synthase
MTESSIVARESLQTRRGSWIDLAARRAVLSRLGGLREGRLTLIEGACERQFGVASNLRDPGATITVHDSSFWSDVAFGGSIGAAESYIENAWSVDDLTAAVRVFARNLGVLDTMEGGLARATVPLRRMMHRLNRNTRGGSRRNIAAHYDLGNEFFALLLDPTLMYSSAIFERDGMTLEEAQLARLDRICRKLALRPHEHLLEIGSGWGALAIYAAQHYGCRVTTTTISRRQWELARERVAAAGLTGRITVLLEDYRDLRGQYDKLVSIEMVEAVGHEFYETYFNCCGRLLRPNGLMLLQAITITDQRYEQARQCVDFIQRYIFPGSTIPSITALLSAAARGSDLRLLHLEDIGPHYARTLAAWRQNFLRNRAAIGALGFTESFQRMWEFYLCYCEGGFEERTIGDAQLLLAKPGFRGAALLGALHS